MIVCLVRVYVFNVKMVKEKPNSIRIYDDEGFRRRAACICVRSDAETEVSIVVLLLRCCSRRGEFVKYVCLLLCRVGAPGDIVATSRQLDSARRRRRARRRALGDRYARGARGGRRHRQAGQVSRGIRGKLTCKHGDVSCTTPSVNQLLGTDDSLFI